MIKGGAPFDWQPAAEIEHMVLSSVRDHFKQSDPIDDRSLINNHVVRVEVQAQR